jgi:hypothetical protein
MNRSWPEHSRGAHGVIKLAARCLHHIEVYSYALRQSVKRPRYCSVNDDVRRMFAPAKSPEGACNENRAAGGHIITGKGIAGPPQLANFLHAVCKKL